jgi:hypothetical protein
MLAAAAASTSLLMLVLCNFSYIQQAVYSYALYLRAYVDITDPIPAVLNSLTSKVMPNLYMMLKY